ncbi:MAG: hypothetical protein AAF617_08375 [Bacteroidota bacterium]
MNFRSVLFVLLFLMGVSSVAQKRDTIYGQVKSIREELTFLDQSRQNKKLWRSEGDYGHYGFTSARFTKGRFHSWWYHTPWVHYLNYYKEFSEDNKVLKEIWYYKSQDTLRYREFEYTDFGKVAKQKEIRYRTSTTTYTYDTHQNLVRTKTVDDKGNIDTKLITYTPDHKVARTTYFDTEDTDEIDVHEHYYDEKGNLISIKKYNECGESYGTLYEYDAKGRKVNRKYHSPFIKVKKDDDFYSKRAEGGWDRLDEAYFYDEKDRIIQVNSYRENYEPLNTVALNYKRKMNYTDGLLSSMYIYQWNDTISSYSLYTYDDEKRRTKLQVFMPQFPKNNRESTYTYLKDAFPSQLLYKEGGEEVIVTFDYVFDEKNNWIQQTKSINGTPLYVWKRKLEYYD